MSENLGNIIGDFTRPLEKDAGSLLSGILKLFGNEPSIDTTPVASASNEVSTATANLKDALDTAASAGTTVLESLADSFVNAGVASVPVLNTFSGVVDPTADADANTAITSLKALIMAKVDALFAPKPAPAPEPAPAEAA